MLTTRAFLRCDVYDAPGCAGGVRLATVQHVLSLVAQEDVAHDDRHTLECPQTDPAASVLVTGNVLRVVYVDGEYQERRIQTVTAIDGPDGRRLSAMSVSLLYDLGDAGPVVQFTGAVPELVGGMIQATATEVLTDVVLPYLADVGLAWVALGTVEPTEEADVAWEWATPLEIARSLQALYPDPSTRQPAEVTWVRDGDVGYRLGLARERNAAHPVIDLRLRKQVRAIQRLTDAQPQANVVVPKGAPAADGVAGTIARAVVRLDANPSGTTWSISDPEGGGDFLLEDGELVGFYLDAGGTFGLREITASVATPGAQTITVLSNTNLTAGRSYEIRTDASAALPVAMQTPSGAALGIRKVRVVDRPELRGERNLLHNPWFRTTEWTGSTPNGWTAAGNVSKNTTATFVRYGGASVRLDTIVVGSVRQDVFPNLDTGTQASLRASLYLTTWTGDVTFTASIKDIQHAQVLAQVIAVPSNHSSPPAGAIVVAANAWLDLSLESVDLAALGATGASGFEVRFALTRVSGNAVGYLDAVFCAQTSACPETPVEFSHANRLWQAGHDALFALAEPLESFDVDVLDLARMDGSTYASEAFVTGATCRVVHPALGIDGALVRIVAQPLIDELVPGRTRLTLGARQQLLQDALVGAGG